MRTLYHNAECDAQQAGERVAARRACSLLVCVGLAHFYTESMPIRGQYNTQQAANCTGLHAPPFL